MANEKNVVEVKPVADVYTVLMIVAILALAVTIFFGGQKLMSKPNPQGNEYSGGYGMTVGQLFEKFDAETAQADN